MDAGATSAFPDVVSWGLSEDNWGKRRRRGVSLERASILL